MKSILLIPIFTVSLLAGSLVPSSAFAEKRILFKCSFLAVDTPDIFIEDQNGKSILFEIGLDGEERILDRGIFGSALTEIEGEFVGSEITILDLFSKPSIYHSGDVRLNLVCKRGY